MAGLDKILYNLARRWTVPRLTIADLQGAGLVFADGGGKLASLSVGKSYFVAGNWGSDVNDGSSWDKALATVEAAMALSHANIALNSHGWASRNVIYITGDDFVEDLTEFAQKTDIIGVGSSDPYKMPCIRGNHAPVGTDSAFMGCRFINVRFRPTASGDLVTLASTSGPGIEFLRCYFEAQYGAYTAPSAIDTTASARVRVIDCDFSGEFSADYIDIGAGDVTGMEIAFNRMRGGADNGVIATGTPTITAGHRGSIHHNFIQCADIVIDTGATSVFDIYGNRCISGEALGAGSYVIDLTYACDNLITGNDVMSNVPALT